MSKFRVRFASAAIASLCTVPTAGVSTAFAQQTTPVLPDSAGPAITQPIQSGQFQSNQLGRQTTGTTTGTASDSSDRYEARREATESIQQGPTVTQALVQKLQTANEAEIELAKMAMKETDNDRVKQLCQTIVQDHQAVNKKLKQLTTQSQSGSSQAPTVPKELCQIADQACSNALEMTKEMLGKLDGQDFNMAFLSQQCVAHTMMLAELKAIESTGPQALKQVAQMTIPKVEKHLDEAKQLAKKLEDDRDK